MANYEIPQYPTKRLRYFNNQFLKDQDFIDDSAYQIAHERAFLRSLCIAGVCEGMAVSYPAGNRPPSVAAGIAIDGKGRMIVLDKPTDGLTPPGSIADGEYFVHIRFLETEDNRATGQGAPDYTRWTQTPVINVTAKAATLPEDVVVLGSCTVAGGVFVQPGTTIGRQYSGLRSSETEPVGSLTLRRDASGQLGPKLTLLNGGGGEGSATAIDFNGYDPGTNDPSVRIGSIDASNFSSHLLVLTKPPGSPSNRLVERLRITNDGAAVFSGPIVAKAGNDGSSGIYFPIDQGGGFGDEAFLRYYKASGTETTKLVLGVDNDPDDALVLWQAGAERLTIANGLVSIPGSLSVTGDISITGNLTSNGTATFNGPIVAKLGNDGSSGIRFPDAGDGWGDAFLRFALSDGVSKLVLGTWKEVALWQGGWERLLLANGVVHVLSDFNVAGNANFQANLGVGGSLTARGLIISFAGGSWQFWDDGNLVATRSDGQVMWSTGTLW